MTFHVNQSRQNWRYSIGFILLPIIGCSSNVSIVHRFRDTSTFAMYAIALITRSPWVTELRFYVPIR